MKTDMEQKSVKYKDRYRYLLYIRRYCVVLALVIASLLGMTIKAEASDLGYKEQIFTSDDGLLTTATLALAQTPDGFVWLGGYGGLSRYDGNEFVAFGGNRVSNVAALLTSEDGTLWISSLDAGLIRYKDNEFFFYNDEDPEKVPVEARELALASDGKVYFAAGNGVGYLDDSKDIHWIEDESLKDTQIADVTCGENGEVWCITGTGEAYSCGDTVTKLDITLENDRLRCVQYNKDKGRFYFGSEKNMVLSCDSKVQQVNRLKVDGVESINSFGFTKAGSIYVCSDDGVAEIRDGKVTDQQLRVENSVEDVMMDMDGNMWFASSRQGVLLVTKGRFRDVSLLADLDDYIVNTLLYEDGRLYIGHDSGCVILNEETYEEISDKNYEFLQGLRVRQMFLDHTGRMWVCTTGNGLYVRNAKGTGWKQYTSEKYPVIRSDKFRAIIDSSLGMVAATDEGAYIINGDEVSLLADGLTMRILSLVEANGAIYAGTDGEGIYVIRDRQIQGQITIEDGLSSMRVMRMCPCSENKGLWMSTGNNLDYLLFETGNVQHADSFPGANIMDCLVMNDTTLWILAGNGVYQTNEEAILRDADARDYRHFTKRNGIPYDLTANSYSIIVDDHAYLCGSEGVTWMDLNLEAGATKEYSLIIDTITTDGEETYVQGEDDVKIDANVRRLEINAHMATYTQENPTVYYYLEGFDESYHYVPFEKLAPIVYTNIPGGMYIFHFGVYDPDTLSAGQEMTMTIKMAYKWYEQPSIRVLFAVLAMACMALISWAVFYATSKKEKRELEQQYLEKEQEMLKKLAYTDYLTGLYNRNYLNNFDIDHVRERKFPISFITVDCNNLKVVNDRFGHKMGDEFLQALSSMMKKNFPEEFSTILRLGGDEFLIIAEGMPGEEAKGYLNRCEEEAAEMIIGDVAVSFCSGLTTCTDPESYNLERLTQEADEQMIVNKQIYHSQVFPTDKPHTVYEADIQHKMERYIKNDILSNVLYEAFAEASDHVFIYVYDMNTGISRWSRNCVEYFGLPAEYISNPTSVWSEHVHPEEREVYEQDITKVLTGERTRHKCQYRARNRFNEYVWVECNGNVIRNANGRNVFAGMITRLDTQSIYDPLTGLKTKNQFYDSIEQYGACAVLMIAIDDFKDIISVYGYENGDKVLVQVGKYLMRWNNEDQKVFRLNGAEFVFLLPNGTKSDVENLFARFTQYINVVYLDNGLKLNLSYTGGAAAYTRGDDTTDSVVNKMERALEYAKQNQRGRCRFYSEEILEGFHRRSQIKKELRESINNAFKGFELYYQPLMEHNGQHIIGCEALLRWKGTLIQDSFPSEFIPILEETGAIVDVGRYVMEIAMRQQKRWSEKYDKFIVAFNVSYHQFLAEGYVDEIVDAAQRYGVDPSCIIIELTESCRVQSPAALAHIFEELRSHGFNIALDDFGTGYASLEMLKKLPSDSIKIEHNFVSGLGKEGNDIDLAIIRSILSLCEELGQKVIVEGIEDEQVDTIIRDMQSGLLQGYYYSKPIRKEAFEELLEDNRK